MRHTSHIAHHTMCLVQNSIILFITLGFNPFHCRLTLWTPFPVTISFQKYRVSLFFRQPSVALKLKRRIEIERTLSFLSTLEASNICQIEELSRHSRQNEKESE